MFGFGRPANTKEVDDLKVGELIRLIEIELKDELQKLVSDIIEIKKDVDYIKRKIK